MHKSNYFEEIASAYRAEIDDLATDSQGRPALQERLKEKRAQIDVLLQMIEFSPEMVIPVLHLAFAFPEPQAVLAVIQSEPDDDDFPSWGRFLDVIEVQAWAKPLIDQILTYDSGDCFLVTAACVEYLRIHDSADGGVSEEIEGTDEDSAYLDSDQAQNPEETVEEWLNKNGFDSLDK